MAGVDEFSEIQPDLDAIVSQNPPQVLLLTPLLLLTYPTQPSVLLLTPLLLLTYPHRLLLATPIVSYHLLLPSPPRSYCLLLPASSYVLPLATAYLPPLRPTAC